MPRLQLGVYLTSGRETENAVKYALEVSSTLIYYVALTVMKADGVKMKNKIK